MGEMPVPGRFVVTLSEVNISPALIAVAATMERRAIGLLRSSLGAGLLTGFDVTDGGNHFTKRLWF